MVCIPWGENVNDITQTSSRTLTSLQHVFQNCKMLCQACQTAFRDDYQDVEVTAKPRDNDSPQSRVFPSPFLKAAHHTLPGLAKSAQQGCHLCASLWDAAPSDARATFYEILGINGEVEWMQCYFTIDRSIFDEAPRSCWLEYKYLTIEQPAEHYVIPFKKQLRLLPYEGILSLKVAT